MKRAGEHRRRAAANCNEASYAAFWTEASGAVTRDGNRLLSVAVPVRPIEEIPTKRRAMYRRRCAMLESLADGVAKVLSPG